jgi:hypothetical protein
MRNEISVKCNDGTRFRIYYRKKTSMYVLEYRNDIIGVITQSGGAKVKNRWCYLESQPNYCDALDFMLDEIRHIDAMYGPL